LRPIRYRRFSQTWGCLPQLPIPSALHDDLEAVEVARVWVGQGDLHVTLNIGMYRDPDGPGELIAWGDILAETVRHVAHGIAEHSGMDEERCLASPIGRMRESLANSERPMEGDFNLDA
jgi:Domain of unknown function (DUF5076)